MPLYPTLADPQPVFFHQAGEREIVAGPSAAVTVPLITGHSPALFVRLDEAGSSVADSSGNSRTGTMHGTGYTRQVSALDGFLGTKLTAAGSDYTDFGHFAAANLSVAAGQAWTLLGTFRWDAAGGGFPVMLGKGDVGLGTGWYVNVAATAGNLQFGVNGVDATHQLVAGAGWTGSGVWKRVAVTCAGRTVTLWVNGASIGSKTFSADYTVTTTNGLWLGRNDWNGTAGYSDVAVSQVGIVNGYTYTAGDVAADWTEASTGVLQGSGGAPTFPGEITPSAPSGPTAPAAGWVTLFGEDFDAPVDWTRFDSAYRQGAVITSATPGWSGPTGLWGTNPGNSELQWCQQANVTVSNGRAVLTAQPQTVVGADGRTYGYTSGMLSTWPYAQFSWATVRTVVEARVDFAAGKGLLGNLWLLPADFTWPPEIDIAAAIGDIPDQADDGWRYVNSTGGTVTGLIGVTVTGALTGEHVYTVDLDPAVGVTWYCDGVQTRQETGAALRAALAAKPLYLLLTNSVGGAWSQLPSSPGAPDATTVWPAQLTCDYLRIWQDATVTPPPSGGVGLIPAAPAGPSGTWTLMMADAFTGAALDRALWGFGETLNGSALRAPGANSYETGAYRSDGFGVATGPAGLTLTATPIPGGSVSIAGRTCWYDTGGVKTFPNQPSQPGFTATGPGFLFNPSGATFVVEAKLWLDPHYTQQFPAFWSSTVDGVWPPEWDWMEMLAGAGDQGRPRGTVQAGSGDSLQTMWYQTASSDPKWAAGWHTFTSQIGPAGAFSYIDGASVGSMTNSSILTYNYGSGRTGLNENFSIILNLSTVGAPGAASMQIKCQYVAVWRKSTDSGGVTPSSGLPIIGSGTVYP